MNTSQAAERDDRSDDQVGSARFHLFRSSSQWYWRLVAADNRIIASSVEGFTTQAECLGAIDRVRECSGTAPVINVVYLDRAVGEPLSQNEVDRLVDSLRRALGVPARGPFAGSRQA